MSGKIRHEMILASAGSGKTYALVNRYLRLLAHGVDPAQIIALTFTRKAAGEFLQKIFARLTEAAGDEDKARKLSEDIQIQPSPASFFKTILVSLVHEMGNLQLGTIDSFFARMVGAFPYELGLTRPHRIMDDFEQGVARAQAMETLMAFGDEDRETLILQLYKELTWGAEEKNVYSLFEDSLQAYLSLYLETSDPKCWGQADRVFKQSPWWLGKDMDKEKLVESIRESLLELEISPANHEKFETLLTRFLSWQPGQPLDNGVLLKRLFESRGDLESGNANIKLGRTELDIEGALASQLLQLIKVYVSQEIARRLIMTQSLGKLLAEYDRLYESSVREAGSLVFSDLPLLLIKALANPGEAFSAEEIIYRLDGQTDHWLIDEFQDTSRVQWKVLSAFVDEILQDPGGQRSFFHVGDIKQSIYGWRGGDSRLFEEIYQRYGSGDDGIKKSHLTHSWRSAPPVLNCVNALFGNAVTPMLCGEEVATRWNEQWAEHEPSEKTALLSGFAGWGLVDSESSIEEGCVELLREVNPLKKGLSCAILMRKNKEIVAMTQALREADIPASMEGRVEIATDNVIGSWIRAFLYSLARPDESFPTAYLTWHGFPYDKGTHSRLASETRTALAGHGFAEALRVLIGFLSGNVEMTRFLNRRADQLLEAATRFEATGVKTLEGFIQFIETASVEESTLSSQIQVMTVHKAKGLDFDMVIVAGFGASPLVRSNKSSLHVERHVDGEVDWILDLPNKAILEAEPCLSAAAHGETGRNVFEALCLLYVAMTRARQGLYCLAHPPTRNSSQTTWHHLFETGLSKDDNPRKEGAIEWHATFGTPVWYSDLVQKEKIADNRVTLSRKESLPDTVGKFLQRAPSPSEESHAEEIFSEELRSPAGRLFGTRMHDLLSLVEWVDADDPSALDQAVSEFPEDLQERVKCLFLSSHGKEVFVKPDCPCDLWREKPYVLRLENRLSYGIIDRAVIYRDPAGNPDRVVIYDYKTDSLDPDRQAEEQLLEKYSVQVERYREAVSVLTGLPLEKISAKLIPV
ncbi:UvrD-helicase domain-containing protein [Puniceicoccales bacterium CK1056]|uniref:DNA 3'-5' helicase n=1 Tax=Oceanipulchritudo coccoides TaxID=2706888 RepID=A0A6B2M0E3_9BACT|nr:UvrD-helicase domain-containing protein [Oceanipulchritudo coccoides]NDV61816.1 UvrD-helicase domain-containing protein [Oceanipulchritudo coccoides]